MEITTIVEFNKHVLEGSKNIPVVVDFWAPWCDPCLILAPIMNDLAEENAGKWNLVKINIDESEAIAEKYNIRSVPTVIVYNNAEICGRYNGLMWKKDFGRWIDDALEGVR
ncbi:MAG: thioredoxin [Bacteroidia bacterium]